MKGKGFLIVISVLVGFYLAHQLTAWIMVCIVWLSLLFIWFKQQRVSLLELIILLLLMFFFSNHFRQEPFELTLELNQAVKLTGKVTEVTSHTNDYTIFTIVDEVSNQQFQISAFTDLDQTIKRGANCRINGELQLPNQGTNPGQFNYQTYLSNQGIHYQIIVNDQKNIHCEGSSIVGKLEAFREKQLISVDERFSEQTATWIKSLIMGDRHDLNEEIEQLFQRWHLTHLLAISGLHISIIVLILHFILIYIFRFTKESTYQLLIGFLFLYPIMAGGAPSVWRASIVSILNYLAWYQRDRRATIDFLSLSFLLLLFLKPDWIYMIGFQFSYIISFAILLSKKILVQIKQPFLKMFFISALSLFIILPIQINSFYLFNPLSLIINILATFYFSAFLIPVIFFTYLTGFLFPPLSALFDFVVTQFNSMFMALLTLIDQSLYYPIVIGKISPLIVILFYLSLFYLLIQLEKKRYIKMINGFICLGLLFLIHQWLPYLNPYGKITILDLGQANSLVMELPHRKAVIMYDVGATIGSDFQTESDRAYEQIIKPFLHQAGINHLDGVILSHEDADHSGSLAYLLDDFTVETVITSAYFHWPESIIKNGHLSSFNHQPIYFGQHFTIGDQLFYPISPVRNWHDPNDNSLVLYTLFTNQAWLFTGDISVQVEQNIIENFPSLKVNTFLVAHHGSNTSSDEIFLASIDADQAIIPVGRNNRYNHPSDVVVERLNDANIPIYRTDYHGAIQYIYHKDDLGGTFLPFIP